MTPRALLLSLTCYAVALAAVCVTLHAVFHLDLQRAPSPTRIVSAWRMGTRSAQKVVEGDASHALVAECGQGCTRIVERIVDQGPLLHMHRLAVAVSLASGRDGIAARYAGKTAYLTPADLLSRQASGEGVLFQKRRLRVGIEHVDELLADLARALGTDTRTLLSQAQLTRFVVRREDAAAALWPRADMDARHVSVSRLTQAISAAGHYLARNQNAEGRFVYELDPTTNRETPDYSWPRHGGATLFLAQAAAFTGDAELRQAAVRGARYFQRSATVQCGKNRCIGDASTVDVGSAAMAVLSYQALIEQGLGSGLRRDVISLAAFMRAQQRPDGEFMHVFDRNQGKPVDVQYEYYTGEASLALGRAARITRDPSDVQAASAALAHLVARTWSVTQNRYLYGTEHWTCQALAELWDRAPDRNALDFCIDYQGFNRQLQAAPGSELGDYAGGFAQNPFFPPRLTPAGSRAEGAAATLETAIAAHASSSDIAALEREVRGALAFMMRFQYLPGPTYLFVDPARVFGALPGAPTELKVRIDYPQHAGGAMLRYARLLQGRAKTVGR